LRFTLRKTGTQPQRPKKIEVCPRCGSVNIKLSSKLDMWLTPKQYICHDCGYRGPVVLELEEDKESQSRTD
jgi:predicted RNA-binding Zn-ribbon protein involved in translation (DUF1610 family)